MPAGILHFTENLIVEAGSKFDHVFTLKDSGGNAIDLTAYDPRINGANIGARMMFRKSYDDTDAAIITLVKTTSVGAPGIEIVSPPTSGKVRIVIRATVTRAASFNTAGDGTPLTQNRNGVIQLEIGGATEADVLRFTDGTFKISPACRR